VERLAGVGRVVGQQPPQTSAWARAAGSSPFGAGARRRGSTVARLDDRVGEEPDLRDLEPARPDPLQVLCAPRRPGRARHQLEVEVVLDRLGPGGAPAWRDCGRRRDRPPGRRASPRRRGRTPQPAGSVRKAPRATSRWPPASQPQAASAASASSSAAARTRDRSSTRPGALLLREHRPVEDGRRGAAHQRRDQVERQVRELAGASAGPSWRAGLKIAPVSGPPTRMLRVKSGRWRRRPGCRLAGDARVEHRVGQEEGEQRSRKNARSRDRDVAPPTSSERASAPAPRLPTGPPSSQSSA